MERPVVLGKMYAVTPTTSCTITTVDGITIATCEAGSQVRFIAPTNTVVISDDNAHLTQVFQ